MSSLEQITEISGFGKSKINNFKQAGYETLEDLQGVTWEELGEISGVKSAAKRRAILNLLEDEGLREKPEKEENYEKFKSLLEELFQFESADLDFGIYKIMNAQRDEIEEFLNEGLQGKVEKELDEFSSVTGEEAEQELEEAKEAIRDDFPGWTDENGEIVEEEFPENPQGVMQERVQDYNEAKEKVEKAEIGEETEAAIYQDLYRFFQRYYKDGDFIPQRRAANQEKYAIPYNGEEVKLHWANKDQYFIKTGEHFKDYKFTKDSYEIEFKVHDAHVEKNNKKGDDKYFVLRDENPVEQEDRFLTVHFEYRPLRDEDLDKYDLSESSRTKARDIQKQVEEKILSEVSSQLEETLNKDTEILYSDSTVLQKHLKNYRTKNENDYFIHKNLGEFLNAELEQYLKNDVFSWKELTDDEGDIPAHVRARLNAIENIAKEIIDFLAAIENYQKKLFEKKKFVVNTEYCITLDKVPEELYSDILNNKEQIEEWKDLYALEEQENEGLQKFTENNEINEEFLKQNQSMMVDTKYFDEDFRYKLLESFSDLENEIEGHVFKGENWQTLNFLSEKYENEIETVYIDPPYNTENSEIIYKNNYKHSSWMSLMENRLSKSKEVLADDASLTVAIDEYEQARLDLLLKETWPEKEQTPITVIHNPGGIQGKNFKSTHEYAYFIHPEDKELGLKDRNDDLVKDDPDVRPFRDVSKGDHLREDAENCFYPIYIEDGEIVGFGEVCDDSYHPESANVEQEDGRIAIYPIDAQGNERKWVFARQNIDQVKDDLEVYKNDQREIWDIKRIKSEFKYKTVWKDKKYNSNSYGSKILNNIMGEEKFTFPKSLHNVKDSLNVHTQFNKDSVVLDYFAGSGTTAQAVLNLNEEDGGNRNYIMVEMGDYFSTVLIPRIKKVVYSEEWEDGVPKSKNRMSHFFQYTKLEDYEDTLNNLDDGKSQASVEEFNSDKLEYFLNFEVDGPSLLDLDGLKNPFSYEMEIREGDEAKKETVDLVETFNYLLGLEVRSIERFEKFDREYRIVEGVIDEDEVAVVWRPVSDEDDKEFYSNEREFVTSQVGDPDRLYVNHDSALEGAKSIEKKFETEMWN